MRITARVWNRHVYHMINEESDRQWGECHTRMRFAFEEFNEPPYMRAAIITRKNPPPAEIVEGLLCDRCMQETVIFDTGFILDMYPSFTSILCQTCSAAGTLYSPDEFRERTDA